MIQEYSNWQIAWDMMETFSIFYIPRAFSMELYVILQTTINGRTRHFWAVRRSTLVFLSRMNNVVRENFKNYSTVASSADIAFCSRRQWTSKTHAVLAVHIYSQLQLTLLLQHISTKSLLQGCIFICNVHYLNKIIWNQDLIQEETVCRKKTIIKNFSWSWNESLFSIRSQFVVVFASELCTMRCPLRCFASHLWFRIEGCVLRLCGWVIGVCKIHFVLVQGCRLAIWMWIFSVAECMILCCIWIRVTLSLFHKNKEIRFFKIFSISLCSLCL